VLCAWWPLGGMGERIKDRWVLGLRRVKDSRLHQTISIQALGMPPEAGWVVLAADCSLRCHSANRSWLCLTKAAAGRALDCFGCMLIERLNVLPSVAGALRAPPAAVVHGRSSRRYILPGAPSPFLTKKGAPPYLASLAERRCPPRWKDRGGLIWCRVHGLCGRLAGLVRSWYLWADLAPMLLYGSLIGSSLQQQLFE